nr:mitochondrial K+-H+ exchange-related protein [uncultured bacterium]
MSTSLEERKLNQIDDRGLSILYLAPERNEPELLLFDERFITEHNNWKQKASEKGRAFFEKAKARYEQVTCDLFAGDRFVRRLERFRKITVLLNHPIDPAEIKNRMKVMMRDRSYHHLRWLIVDILLLPLSLLAMPIPGPNLIGYYLLFRVYSHWKAYRSASKTRLDEVDVQVSQQADEVRTALRNSKDVRTALTELRSKYGLRALQEHEFIPQRAAFREAWLHFKKSLHSTK